MSQTRIEKNGLWHITGHKFQIILEDFSVSNKAQETCVMKWSWRLGMPRSWWSAYLACKKPGPNTTYNQIWWYMPTIPLQARGENQKFKVILRYIVSLGQPELHGNYLQKPKCKNQWKTFWKMLWEICFCFREKHLGSTCFVSYSDHGVCHQLVIDMEYTQGSAHFVSLQWQASSHKVHGCVYSTQSQEQTKTIFSS